MIPVGTTTRTVHRSVCADGTWAAPRYTLAQLDKGKCWKGCSGGPHRRQECTVTTTRTEWVDFELRLELA